MRSLNGNGRAHGSATSGPGARPSATAPHGAAARPGQQRSSRTVPDTAQVQDSLAAAREELGAALIEIAALRKRDSVMREQVAALVQAVAKARRFAHRDELTGLPNRRLLMDRFNQAVAQCERQHKQAALLFLDLDEFKHINDTLGHAAGDAVLQQVAARLTACIRISDTVCRFGGDEFVVLLPEIQGEQDAAAVTEKIRAQLAAPYAVAGAEITLTASIGIAVYPLDGKDYGELIRVSDREMYRKKDGRTEEDNRYV